VNLTRQQWRVQRGIREEPEPVGIEACADLALLFDAVPEKKGVEDVAGQAFRRHYGQVYRFLRRRTGDHHRAEELTQQVFADAAASLRETSSPELAWLYTVAQRRFADEVRRISQRRSLAQLMGPRPEAADYGSGLAASLGDALARLPEGQRQVVVLKLLRGAPFAEIGEMLGVSEASAKMRFVRALESVRADLEQGGRAMSLRDPEVLELLRDEPELLALADAVAATQSPPAHRRLRTPPRLLAGVAAVAALVFALVLFLPGGGSNGILDRALAAIGQGRVLHLVMRMPTDTGLVELKSGRHIVETAELELWSDRDSGRTHVVWRLPGGLVFDVVVPDDLPKGAHGRGGVGKLDPAFTAVVSGYRQALASGQAKLERQGRLGGRTVYWLRFAPLKRGDVGTEVAIDRTTYKPVLFRVHDGSSHVDYQVVTAETIPFQPADFKRHGPNPLDGVGVGGVTSSSGSVFSHDVPVKLEAPWLTAGSRVAGLPLAGAHEVQASAQNGTIEGIQLTYGTTRGFLTDAHSLTIQELPRPDDPASWADVPKGYISITHGGGTENGVHYPLWTGYLVSHGIYVTIETGRGERALLAAAQALRQAP
jgi:RNA polymerase sigma-70 factor (ECF subfamily)